MKKSGLSFGMFLLLGLSILFIHTVEAQPKNFIDQPYLETTVKVDTLVVPDRIYLNILLTEADTKGRTSVEELENPLGSARIGQYCRSGDHSFVVTPLKCL